MAGAIERSKPPRKRKASLPQSDVPSASVRDALRVARAISDQLGRAPASPLQVAAAMGVQPTTGGFRMITAASVAYGFTDGGAWAERIALTPLGRAAVAPLSEGEDRVAITEAVMRPRVVREFLDRYDRSKWPRRDIGCNVLVELGVPVDQAARAFDIIYKNANEAGFLTDINGNEFVSLEAQPKAAVPPAGPVTDAPASLAHGPDGPPSTGQSVAATAGFGRAAAGPPASSPAGVAGSEPSTGPAPGMARTRRVFISHRADDSVAEEITTLLRFGDLEPVAADHLETAHEDPFAAMRGCTAGIVLIDADRGLAATTLLEVGAGMALFSGRLVLVAHESVALPAEVQHLKCVRFAGQGLDQKATLGLMAVLVDFKKGVAA